MRSQFFLRLVRRALANRLGKWMTAVVAVAMGASLVSASLSLAFGMQAKMSQALRAYGANIHLVPAGGAAAGEQLFARMSETVLARLGEVARGLPLLGYAPLLYTVAEIGTARVAVVGTWPDAMRQVNPWWHVEGKWIDDRAEVAEAIAGSSIARKLGMSVGAPLTLTVAGRSATFRVVGILSTGSSEDEQVVVTLRAVQALTGRAGEIHLILVSALTTDEDIEAIASRLDSALPGVTARTQLRAVKGEQRVLARLSLLLGLIAGLVLVASALGVAASATTSVLERTREIGLMKALGASRWRVGVLFLSEAGAIGLIGGLLGAAVGLLLAQTIARSVFGGTVPFSAIAAVASASMGIGVAGIASMLPVYRAAGIQPGMVLRGE